MSVILAVDASSKTAGVCILRDGEILYERIIDRGLTHSETFLPLIDSALTRCRIKIEDLSLLAVTAGPGSFTGLRIGMSTVKGLAFAGDIPVVAVSTLEAMARPYEKSLYEKKGIVLPALDARRGEVYWAAFDNRQGLTRLVEDTASPALQIKEKLQIGQNPVFCIGDGAEICYTILTYDYCVTWDKAVVPVARGVALLALDRLRAGDVQTSAEIAPCYLRLSQAERERLKKYR